MDTILNTVVLFELGTTLASVRRPAPREQKKPTIDVYAGVRHPLEELARLGVRVGVVSAREGYATNDDGRELREALPPDVTALLDADMIISASSIMAALEIARARTDGQGGPGSGRHIVLVSDEATDRVNAEASGFRAAPHPRLALSVVLGRTPLRYLRIRIPPGENQTGWENAVRSLAVVPLHVTREPAGKGAEPDAASSLTAFAIADPASAAALDDLGFWVDRLGAEDEPQSSNLYLLRDDRQMDSGFLGAHGNSVRFFSGENAGRVLASSYQGLIVALPAAHTVARYHFADTRHGHNLRLSASVNLVAMNGRPAAEPIPSPADASAPAAVTAATATPGPALTPDERERIVKAVDPARFKHDVDTFSAPLEQGGKFRSRDIRNPGNAEAVDQVVAALEEINTGLQASGREPLAISRRPFFYHGIDLENVEARLPGYGGNAKEVVVVSAHLDSTGQAQFEYDPSRDPAPGADDDASGMAGVLAVLRSVAELLPARAERREIRFLFFNAEEPGLEGSGKYAAEIAAHGDKVVAAFQLDMIGFTNGANPRFEVHAGVDGGHSPLEDQSQALALLVQAVSRDFTQTYQGSVECEVFPEAGKPDPAIGRSDHTRFHDHRFPACLVTEDFFAGPGPTTGNPNPGYHSETDQMIKEGYATEIVRAVAGAVWLTATT